MNTDVLSVAYPESPKLPTSAPIPLPPPDTPELNLTITQSRPQRESKRPDRLTYRYTKPAAKKPATKKPPAKKPAAAKKPATVKKPVAIKKSKTSKSKRMNVFGFNAWQSKLLKEARENPDFMELQSNIKTTHDNNIIEYKYTNTLSPQENIYRSKLLELIFSPTVYPSADLLHKEVVRKSNALKSSALPIGTNFSDAFFDQFKEKYLNFYDDKDIDIKDKIISIINIDGEFYMDKDKGKVSNNVANIDVDITMANLENLALLNKGQGLKRTRRKKYNIKKLKKKAKPTRNKKPKKKRRN